MSNVSHNTLTGADLHESKGTAAAAADTVFVADGAGSGVFKKVPGTALAGLGNPFGAQLLHVQEAVGAGGSSAIASTINSWVTVPLTTVRTSEFAGVGLTSSQLTLPVGTYFIECEIPVLSSLSSGQTGFYKPRLFNFTTSATLVDASAFELGVSSGTAVAVTLQSSVRLYGRFTLSGSSVVVLQSYKTSAFIPVGVGIAGVNEVYTNCLIWKIS